MSGNPRLVVAPYKAPRLSITAPPLTLQTDSMLAPSPAPLADTAAGAVKISVDRPRIDTLAVAERPAAVRDILAARAAPLPSAPAPADVSGTPARLQMVAPVYPPRAMSAGVEGNVELEYRVGTDGVASNVRVVRAQPEGVFDAAAISALGQWRFQSGNGASRYVQNFAFTLHKEPGTASKEKCQQVIGSLICRQFDE
jgi:protein TonB